jgi:hypothetical protein
MTINQLNYTFAVLGLVVSNIILLIFAGRFESDRPDRSIFINLFGNNFHLHHWIIGLFGLIFALIFEQLTSRNFYLSSFKGVFFGMIFHGLVFYNDYFKIK